MEFAKLAEKQVFDRVADCTQRVRRGDTPHPAIPDILRRHGIEPERAVFPFLGALDDDLFSGTVVTQDRRVLEFVIDTAEPDESTVDDVTAQLGARDPRHPGSDLKDVITMALHWFDHLARQPTRTA